MALNITFQGSPLTLVGRRLGIGKSAPHFKVISNNLKESGLADFKGKIKVISTFPSLDTPVCDLQVKEFNKKISEESSDIAVLGISMDLPFAQSRFCSLNGIKNETVLSDYRYSSFGINYGLLIKELKLLARAALIIDKNDVLRYIQIAHELTKPLDYDLVLKNLKEIIKSPALDSKEPLPSSCKPCEGKIAPIPKDRLDKLLALARGWEPFEDKRIVKEFQFSDFSEAKYFLDLISIIAEEQGHHPGLNLIYNKLKVTLTTHSSGGLTENDFIMAKIIDELGV